MLTQSGVVNGSSRRLIARVAARDRRPRAPVRGRFAGEIAGIELSDGGVEVVGVEGDERRGPLVGVELADTEDIGAERIGSRVAARGAPNE